MCSMKNEERRKSIVERLKVSKEPISATSLAKEYLVTRQIIVADIALLRASGYSISAEHKGYILNKAEEGIIKRIVVQHGKDSVKDELYAIVDNGGKVLDVIIEHSIYGKISAELNLSSRYEVDIFEKKIKETGTNPLSLLTDGFHVHTISLKNEDSFSLIIDKLSELKILIESD